MNNTKIENSISGSRKCKTLLVTMMVIFAFAILSLMTIEIVIQGYRVEICLGLIATFNTILGILAVCLKGVLKHMENLESLKEVTHEGNCKTT